MDIPDKLRFGVAIVSCLFAIYVSAGVAKAPAPEDAEGLIIYDGTTLEAVLPPDFNAKNALLTGFLPEKVDSIVSAKITKYNNLPEQTDDTPDIMASGNRVYDGAIACPSFLRIGTIVGIDGDYYICEDRMNERYRNGYYFDIFSFSYDDAISFGRQTKEVVIYTN